MAAQGKRTRRKSTRPPSPRRKIAEQPRPPLSPPVLILNTTARRGRAQRTWARVRNELRSWRTMPEIMETQYAGHGTELAKNAAAAGASLVIAAGGDGTAHEVVQGLMEAQAGGSGTAFAHLPLGTGCDLARGLGLPTNPSGILRGLRQWKDTYVDVGATAHWRIPSSASSVRSRSTKS